MLPPRRVQYGGGCSDGRAHAREVGQGVHRRRRISQSRLAIRIVLTGKYVSQGQMMALTKIKLALKSQF